jgi:predicted nucleic acid-binding protein
MAAGGIEQSIEPGATLLIDSSAILAYLDGTEGVSGVAADVFDRLIASGRNPAVVSTVSVTEALVRPFRAGSASAAGTVDAFFRSFPNLAIQPVTYEIAVQAAQVRGATALRTPDAMILATAAVVGCEIVVANDGRWLVAIERAGLTVRLCHLDEFGGEA